MDGNISKIGSFLWKLDYNFVITNQGREVAYSSGIVGDFYKKKSFGRLGFPKCLHFVWRACKNILLVMTNLRTKKLEVDIICPRCGEGENFVVHAFLLCVEVKRCWFASSFRVRFHFDENVSFASWFEECLQIVDKEFLGEDL